MSELGPTTTRTFQAAVVVAHPDDETLWAGGLILQNPEWQWCIQSVCRGSDPDRSPRFHELLKQLRADGGMADLNDGPEQCPLPANLVEDTLVKLLPERTWDLVLTHGPRGEYTRHRRHEEVCRAVLSLWQRGALRTRALWMFAYEDQGPGTLPRAELRAHLRTTLPRDIWEQKLHLITQTYGFAPDSWEGRAAPREEAFWCFARPSDARSWMAAQETVDEDTDAL